LELKHFLAGSTEEAEAMNPILDDTEFGKFLGRNRACKKALPWASQMTTYEEGYDNCPHPNWLLWAMRIARVYDRQAFRHWGCWCARQIAEHITDPVCRQALDTAERFLEGKAGREELSAIARTAGERAAGASWPDAVSAWAARAAADAAGNHPIQAAKAALEVTCLVTPGEDTWKATLQRQVDKLREFVGAEGRARVLTNLRKLDGGEVVGPAMDYADSASEELTGLDQQLQ
jgi:hypothetical protein